MDYISFDHINKSFGENQVLKDISLDIGKGQLVTLLGPSGCGKSTLLRCLAGLENVTSGKVYLDGKDITNVDPKERDIGMVFQQYSLFPNMNVEQNVGFGLKMKKVPKEEIRKKVDQILKTVGLEEKKKQYPSQLSGGQQQRAALARAIVTEPKVLLLDEPLSAIDAQLRHSLQVEIRKIQKELNITAIFVTHDQDEAMVMSDMIYLMYQGKIEQTARPTELYTHPKTKFAASFIGHYNILKADQFYAAAGMGPGRGMASGKEMAPGGETALAEGTVLEGNMVPGGEVAFRPEVVGISRTREEKNDCFCLKGTVGFSLPHGNILRYEVKCEAGIQIDVDVLFGTTTLFDIGQEIYLTIPKAHCLTV